MRKKVLVGFDAPSTITSIRYRASLLHGTIISWTWTNIITRLKKEQKSHLLYILPGQEQFVPVGNVMSIFPADLTIRYAQADSSPVLIQEVGYTEPYENLLKSVSAWFDNVPSVQTAILMKIDEKLNYQPPDLRYPSSKNPSYALLPKDIQHLHVGDNFSPIRVDEYRWVGEITVFMEIWIRGPVTKRPTLKGDRIVSQECQACANRNPNLAVAANN